ncbi:MAG: hypothetical protein JXB34_15355 [Bacteroidales bacterium]|nr:hypothetical protein [Bacteroidales bacterium]
MKNYLLLFTAIVLFVSCSKEAGEGGTSTIKGVVMVKEYNGDYTILRDIYPAQDIDVYIIYGNDEVHGDRFQTGYDGKYEFNYLRNGKYTVYALSDSAGNILTNEKVPVFKEVEVTGKNQVIEVDTIYILD